MYTFFNQATTVLACSLPSIHHIISVSEQIMTRKAEVGIARTHKHRPECLELVCAQNTLNVVAYQIGLKVFVDIGVDYWGNYIIENHCGCDITFPVKQSH